MRNQPTLPFPVYLCLIFMSLIASNLTLAQDGFYELNASSGIAESKSSEREKFHNLVSNLHPTAYINNGILKIGGNSGYNNLPVVKLTFHDSKSFFILNQSNTQFNAVELITVKLLTETDLVNRLDLTEISGLNQLKYIYVECYFECTEPQITDFLILGRPNIRVFYKLTKPS